ncbi:MAG: inner membrane protein YpjD [Bryobacteraceae bacterium]
MTELSAIWLRVAAVFYSLGLIHAFLTVIQRRDNLFRWALASLRIGAVFHFVAVIEEGLLTHHFPANTVYESISLFAFLMAMLFLVAHWRYHLETLSVVVYPLIFMMTLIAGLGRPVAAWSSPVVRSAWLTLHVVLVLLGYAAFLLTAVGAMAYLLQERELKRKKPQAFYYRLPPLGTLDEVISRSMAVGFVLVTVAVVVAATWAFVEVGTGWITDPKIVISLGTWLLYLAMIFLRVSAGWRGRKAAVMALTALGCSAITWIAHAGLRSVWLP